MEWLWGGLGWLVGWALNAVVHELPRGHAVAWPRCAACERRLSPLALSALLPRGSGRCAGCGARPLRLGTGLELPTAVLFGALAWRYGLSVALIANSAFAAFLVAVLAIDLRHRWVYGVICYPGVLLGLLLSPLAGPGPIAAVAGALAGGGLFFLLYWLGRLLYHGQEPMGSGDITIAAMIGAMVGIQRVLPALFLGGILVAVVSVVLLLLRRAGARSYLPYGAGLCAGALLVLLLPDGG
ncbi:MAG TPA: A24 family peptidase [Chloroflexota bacterium]|nr:A24 family peptidase [Chloroflexota bacterium]